jgi:acetyltransferase-like isoleucine patch superfamily enzyme
MRDLVDKDITSEPKLRNAKAGKNAKIRDGCQLNNVQLGDNVQIGRNVTIFGSNEKPVIIGDNCYIPYGCFFSGAGGSCQITIGKNVIFSPYCVILTGSGPTSPGSQSSLSACFNTEVKDVIIGNDCWIMTRSTILPGANLGKGVAVAAHSLVKDSFEDYSLIGGVPAKLIRKLGGEIVGDSCQRV